MTTKPTNIKPKPKRAALAHSTPVPRRVLRLKGVMAKTGLARSTIYALIAKGKFPAPAHPTEKTSIWDESEIENYIERAFAARDGDE
jgi:prophage regulatory protein